jgi:hypothetical protein
LLKIATLSEIISPAPVPTRASVRIGSQRPHAIATIEFEGVNPSCGALNDEYNLFDQLEAAEHVVTLEDPISSDAFAKLAGQRLWFSVDRDLPLATGKKVVPPMQFGKGPGTLWLPVWPYLHQERLILIGAQGPLWIGAGTNPQAATLHIALDVDPVEVHGVPGRLEDMSEDQKLNVLTLLPAIVKNTEVNDPWLKLAVELQPKGNETETYQEAYEVALVALFTPTLNVQNYGPPCDHIIEQPQWTRIHEILISLLNQSKTKTDEEVLSLVKSEPLYLSFPHSNACLDLSEDQLKEYVDWAKSTTESGFWDFLGFRQPPPVCLSIAIETLAGKRPAACAVSPDSDIQENALNVLSGVSGNSM